jgi:hypothetical protein
MWWARYFPSFKELNLKIGISMEKMIYILIFAAILILPKVLSNFKN